MAGYHIVTNIWVFALGCRCIQTSVAFRSNTDYGYDSWPGVACYPMKCDDGTTLQVGTSPGPFVISCESELGRAAYSIASGPGR